MNASRRSYRSWSRLIRHSRSRMLLITVRSSLIRTGLLKLSFPTSDDSLTCQTRGKKNNIFRRGLFGSVNGAVLSEDWSERSPAQVEYPCPAASVPDVPSQQPIGSYKGSLSKCLPVAAIKRLQDNEIKQPICFAKIFCKVWFRGFHSVLVNPLVLYKY